MRKASMLAIVVTCIATSVEASNGPTVSIPQRIPGIFGMPVVVPVEFNGNGEQISAMILSVDYDEVCLHFDDADADADGLPDDIFFAVPAQFSTSVIHEPRDSDGELDFVIADFAPPLAALPDGEIAFIILTPICQPDPWSILARVGFSDDPPVSFGDTGGQGVAGKSFDGSVEIGIPIFGDGFESGDTSAWSATVGDN